jgi:type II secretory pathway component PulJ
MTHSRHTPSATSTPPCKPKAVRPRANHPWLRTILSLTPRLTALGLYGPTRHHVSADRRRGASLFELMAAMSAASVVIAASAALVHRTFSIDSRSRAVVADEHTALRLARLFRTDIHEATTVTCPGGDADPPLVAIKTQGSSIVYRANGSGLVRVATSGTADAAHESFSFARPVTWHAAREGRLVTLSGSAAADATPRPRLGLEIVAATAARSAVTPQAPGGSP